MTNTYNDYANKTRSSKLVLCHVEPTQRLSVFENVDGNIYKKLVMYNVIGIKEDNISLTEASSESVGVGEWFFNHITSELFINCSDGLDPKKHTIKVTYRLYYSNRPIDLPYDLSSGYEVHYDGRLKNSTPIRKELDDEQIGIMLEASTSVSFDNGDKYFDDIYDKLIFENQSVKIYSWSEVLPLSEKKKTFDGIIENKSYSPTSVRFRCKDFTFTLRQPLTHENFKEIDGSVPDQYLFTPKRRIFGQVKQLQCVPVDAVLDGFALSGLSSVSASDRTKLIGVGTSFLDQVSIGDQIIFTKNGTDYSQSVSAINSNIELVFQSEYPIIFQSAEVKSNPTVPYNKKNRRWNIAGHKLRSPATSVTSTEQANRFAVADASEFFAGDFVNVNGENSIIRRVSGNNIVLRTNLQSGKPTIGYTMTKNSVSSVFTGEFTAVLGRDYSIENISTGATVIFTNDFEFNVAPISALDSELIFTGSSRTISVSSGDPRNEIKNRDWISSGDENHNVYYQVLSVNETSVVLRSAYNGSTNTSKGKIKKTNIINDNSIVTVNCIGQERSNKWVKTASDAVRDLLINDCGISSINEDSFSSSSIDFSGVISYATPRRIGGRAETVRTVIDNINTSVFGSLVIDNNFNLTYKVLTADKPNSLREITDHDLSNSQVSIVTKNAIVRKVSCRYASFTDRFTGDDAFSLYEYVSEFSDEMIGATSEKELDLYLFNRSDAETITQRYAYYNSLSQSVVTIKGKLNLYDYFLNELIWIGLDRIYKRLGNNDRRKLGIINKIANDGSDINLTINDIGNTLNRTATITENTASNFTSSTESEKIIYNYIVDNDSLTPDPTSDQELYTNLIG